MKKFIALALVLVLCLSLAACGAKKEAGTKLAVQKGTTSFMYADMIKNVTVVPYDTFALAANDMKNGNADYVVVDKTTGNAICKEIAGLKIIDIPLSSENYGIAIDPNQADLKTKIDGILTDKVAEIDAIKEKYMNGETDKYVGIIWYFRQSGRCVWRSEFLCDQAGNRHQRLRQSDPRSRRCSGSL